MNFNDVDSMTGAIKYLNATMSTFIDPQTMPNNKFPYLLSSIQYKELIREEQLHNSEGFWSPLNFRSSYNILEGFDVMLFNSGELYGHVHLTKSYDDVIGYKEKANTFNDWYSVVDLKKTNTYQDKHEQIL